MTQYRYPNEQVITVIEPYYPASCDGCGWQGSSGECGTDSWGDDSDVYCPSCSRRGADFGKAAASAARIQTNGQAEL